MTACAEILEALPWYVNETLADDERRRVAAHLESCDGCIAALDDWRRIAAGVLAGSEETVTAGVKAAPAPPARRPRTSHAPGPPLGRRELVTLARAQARLLPLGLWPAVAAILAIGVALVLATSWPERTALGVLAPLAAAASVALTCTPQNDPRLDLALASPVSPRLVLLARLVVVLAYDLAVALVASAVIVAIGGEPLGPLLGAWLVPMLALSGAALLATTMLDAGIAMAFAFGLWTLRWVIPAAPGTPLLLAIAAVCVALATLRFERVAS